MTTETPTNKRRQIRKYPRDDETWRAKRSRRAWLVLDSGDHWRVQAARTVRLREIVESACARSTTIAGALGEIKVTSLAILLSNYERDESVVPRDWRHESEIAIEDALAKSETIRVVWQPHEMAAVYVGEALVMYGNHWDFHPGCHGLYRWGDWRTPVALAESLQSKSRRLCSRLTPPSEIVEIEDDTNDDE